MKQKTIFHNTNLWNCKPRTFVSLYYGVIETSYRRNKMIIVEKLELNNLFSTYVYYLVFISFYGCSLF